ncbi:MAG: hypothetical protein R3F16_05820 [Myxococcota bacterium]
MEAPPTEPAPSPRVPPAPVEGHCDPAFRAVEAAFRENFAIRNEIGGALCVIVDGRPVVDLWGGHRDEARAPFPGSADTSSTPTPSARA